MTISKDFIAILTVTLITVVAWIAFEIYHNRTAIYISPEIRKQAEPLNPKLDQEYLNQLKQLNNN